MQGAPELNCRAWGTSFANFTSRAPVFFMHCRVCRRCFFIPVCSTTQSLFRRPKNVKNLVRMEADALTCRLAGNDFVLLGLLV